jgi:protein-tyrosine phosphatase
MPLIHTWFPIGGGWIAVGPRPGRRTYADLAAASDVVTLLSVEEGASQIAAQVERMGLRWWHLPLPGAAPLGSEADPPVEAMLGELRARLAVGARVYLHCSAGIHRTGMIAACLLHSLGLDSNEVLAALEAMRPVTRLGVGDERLAVARRFHRSASAPPAP